MRLALTCLLFLTATIQAAEPPLADALTEVNMLRAQRGLPPFRADPNLQAGATAACNYRAWHHIEGHCGGRMGDFAFLPHGGFARATGCAVRGQGAWFAACCLYERQWTYAGAAKFVGPDGRVYCHLFVR